MSRLFAVLAMLGLGACSSIETSGEPPKPRVVVKTLVKVVAGPTKYVEIRVPVPTDPDVCRPPPPCQECKEPVTCPSPPGTSGSTTLPGPHVKPGNPLTGDELKRCRVLKYGTCAASRCAWMPRLKRENGTFTYPMCLPTTVVEQVNAKSPPERLPHAAWYFRDSVMG